MQDIRLVGNDGEYLNLETQSGDKFRLVLDDSLRAAVKRDVSLQLDNVSISPREIQDAVRAGATPEEVSAKYDVPQDYVDKFALTVVDEIGHIIASAQAVRISIEADRYSEATQIEFGEVVSERVGRIGGANLTWNASKNEGSPWQVTATYEVDGLQQAAVWVFDQRKLVLSPENEQAIGFSAGDHAASVSTPKLRPIEIEDPDATKVIEFAAVEEPQPAAPLSVVSSIEELTRASVEAHEPPLAATADLLEALRKKRAGAAEKSAEAEIPVESSINKPVEIAPEPTGPIEKYEPETTREAASSAELSEPAPTAAPEPITPPAKKGRPSMPSWDEIVFGTKTED
jgi:Protein of unknown function (DUF3071)